MPMRPRFRSSFVAVAILALVLGAALLAYGRWSEPLAEAAGATEAGDRAAAVDAYKVSAERFRTIPATQQLLSADHALVSHNQLALLYQLNRYDELLEAAADAPPDAAPHFWAGCALFQKSTQEEKPESQLEWLTRAEDEFKLALEAAPDDWDTKYNYELSARLAAALRPPSKKGGTQQKSVPSTLLQLLRRAPQQQQDRPVKKVG